MALDSKGDLITEILSDDAKIIPPKTEIKRSRLGLWDFYEEVEIDGARISLVPLLAKLHELSECLPYVARMFKDVLSVPGCTWLMLVYAATQICDAIIPAASIWCVSWRTIVVRAKTNALPAGFKDNFSR